MTWINTISFEASKGKLRKLYDRVKGPDNNVDNPTPCGLTRWRGIWRCINTACTIRGTR